MAVPITSYFNIPIFKLKKKKKKSVPFSMSYSSLLNYFLCK